jgi:hypothetical protein
MKKKQEVSKKEAKLSKPFPLPNLPKTDSQITAHGLKKKSASRSPKKGTSHETIQ